MISAKVSGINVNKYLVTVYTIAGGLAGLAGVVLAARVSSGQSSMGQSYELDAIAVKSAFPMLRQRERALAFAIGDEHLGTLQHAIALMRGCLIG